MHQRQKSFLILLLALGGQTLIVELTIPRLIAPVFGNTLFCWTAIIAVVLIALTLGYHLGGRWASRISSGKWIIGISAGAAVWVILLALLGQNVVNNLTFFDLMFGPLVATLILAAVPAFLDALVVPLVIELRTENQGEAAGKCFAWSTVGSIIGVLTTGYVLLPFFGITGALLIGAGFVFLAIAYTRAWPTAMIGLVACVAAYSMGQTNSPYLVDISNGYHRIKVTETGIDPKFRNLYLDTGYQGSIQVGSIEPVTAYHKLLSRLYPKMPEFNRIIQLGGGTFSIPSEIKAKYPDVQMEVAEIDPDVVDIGRQYMGLKDNIIVHTGDARQVLKQQTGKYDLIINDAFKGVRNIPYHMTSLEFAREVNAKLTDNGLYVMNVRGTAGDSHVTGSMIKTLQEVFEFIHVVPVTKGNTWVIASRSKPAFGIPAITSSDFGFVLTDDHSPIEYLVVRDLIRINLKKYSG